VSAGCAACPCERRVRGLPVLLSLQPTVGVGPANQVSGSWRVHPDGSAGSSARNVASQAASRPWSSTEVVTGAFGTGAHPIWCMLRNDSQGAGTGSRVGVTSGVGSVVRVTLGVVRDVPKSQREGRVPALPQRCPRCGAYGVTEKLDMVKVPVRPRRATPLAYEKPLSRERPSCLTFLLTATPTSIIANPLSAACTGSTLSEFRAQATYVDGVKSLRLDFKKPGATSCTSREFSPSSGIWTSFINTVSTVDNIVRTGSISWYVVATDTKGATKKTAVKTITVTRCDTPASFATGPYTPKKLYPTRPISIQIQADASDADGVASVTLR